MTCPSVESAWATPEFLEKLSRILTRADEAIAQASPACKGCGQCCDFAKMDHRLYVSTGELALLSSTPPPQPAEPLKCPYQIDDKCSARLHRPLGCRVYFCQSNLPENFYEVFHKQILDLHSEYKIPYNYMELTQALLNIF